jgi:hypothetical protein
LRRLRDGIGLPTLYILAWSVTADGIPLEAQLENRETGTYHGYPLPEHDEFRATVLRAWNAAR